MEGAIEGIRILIGQQIAGFLGAQLLVAQIGDRQCRPRVVQNGLKAGALDLELALKRAFADPQPRADVIGRDRTRGQQIGQRLAHLIAERAVLVGGFKPRVQFAFDKLVKFGIRRHQRAQRIFHVEGHAGRAPGRDRRADIVAIGRGGIAEIGQMRGLRHDVMRGKGAGEIQKDDDLKRRHDMRHRMPALGAEPDGERVAGIAQLQPDGRDQRLERRQAAQPGV